MMCYSAFRKSWIVYTAAIYIYIYILWLERDLLFITKKLFYNKYLNVLSVLRGMGYARLFQPLLLPKASKLLSRVIAVAIKMSLCAHISQGRIQQGVLSFVRGVDVRQLQIPNRLFGVFAAILFWWRGWLDSEKLKPL